MHRPLLRAFALAVGLSALAFPALAQDGDRKSPYPHAELDSQHKQAVVTSGRVTATLNVDDRKSDGYVEEVPILQVFVDSKPVLKSEGVSAGETAYGDAEIVDMDDSNALPEVVFSSYSGGAHCCTQVMVATGTKNGAWIAVDLGEWDGGGDYLEDADHDGRPEFVAADQIFLYAFDCYACSAAPLKILQIRNGKAVDVTREPQFQAKLREWVKALEGWRQPNGEFQPGFYAGWIAAKSMIGEGREAWETMMKAYKPSEVEKVEVCRDTGLYGECSDEQRVQVPFPVALKTFLDKNGYTF